MIKVEIINIDPKLLVAYGNNAKEHDDKQIKNIATSIKKYGFKQPVLIDKDNVLIAGHGRVLGALKLNLDIVPCLVADDLTEEQIKEYRILDNKLNESEWDFDLLNLELDDLDFSDFELDFDDLNLDEDDKEVVEDDFDVEENIPDEPVAKLGDVWELGRHKIGCLDSTKKESFDLLLNGVKPELHLTDPPYGINAVDNNGKIGASCLAKTKKYAKIIGDDTTETACMNYMETKDIAENHIMFGGNYFTDFLPPSPCWVLGYLG